MIVPFVQPSAIDVGSHYDDLDSFYRELWGEHLHHGFWERGDEDPAQAVCALVDRVAAAARLAPGSAVCDVGCGYGATARRLTERFGARVVGFTVSRAQAAYAEGLASGQDSPRIFCRDWLDNGLPSESFDAVVAIESFAHFGDKSRFLSEAFRVLRPGGRLVVCAWLSGDEPSPWQRRGLLEPICREGRLAGLPTSGECVAWAKGAGFVDVACEDWTRKVRRTWAICARRLVGAVAMQPRYRAFLLNGSSEHRVFAFTVLRILAAYAVGAMKYGFFEATRPERGDALKGAT
jgi:tocopherol O-methyltransferase